MVRRVYNIYGEEENITKEKMRRAVINGKDVVGSEVVKSRGEAAVELIRKVCLVV